MALSDKDPDAIAARRRTSKTVTRKVDVVTPPAPRKPKSNVVTKDPYDPGERGFKGDAEVDFHIKNNARLYDYLEQRNAVLQGYPSMGPPLSGGGGTAGGGGGGGGGRGGGLTAEQIAAAKAAVANMWQVYNRAPDQGARDLLATLTQQAQGQAAPAVSALQQLLAGQANPYASLPQAAPTVAVNPLQQYLQAAGIGSDTSNQSLIGMLQSQNNAAATAQNNLAAQLQASFANQQQGQIADASRAQAGFDQALAQNEMVGRLKLDQQERARKDELMQQILQLAAEYGLNLKNLGVTF